MQKRRDFLRSVPAIALAASASQDIQQKAIELGEALSMHDGAAWRVSVQPDFILIAREPLELGLPDPDFSPSTAS